MKHRGGWLGLVALTLIGTFGTGCRDTQTPPPTPTPALAVASEPTETPTPLPTSTPTATPTPAPTNTPTPMPEPTAGTSDAGVVLPPVDLDFITLTLDSGWDLYELPGEGFSISLPPGWAPVDMNAEGLSSMLDAIGEQNPQLGGFLGSQALTDMVAEGMVFYALDLDPQALELGMPASVNVLEMETGIALPLDVIVPLTLSQLEGLALPEVPITNERLDLEGLEAELIRYVGDFSSVTGGTLTVSFTQFVIPIGGKLYVISLSAPLDLEADYGDLMAAIGSTFRLLD